MAEGKEPHPSAAVGFWKRLHLSAQVTVRITNLGLFVSGSLFVTTLAFVYYLGHRQPIAETVEAIKGGRSI